MIRLAITFLVIALIAAVLGLSGIMSVAVHIAWILALIGIVLFVVHALSGRSAPR